ncbi:MAG: divalent-cation tolerance protein CutA [Neisseriaceae bacterium]|nr:divalent-cation tolerance protein CutA [Neisseriaceae bacterium]MBP6861794.1 divalent-cation tolerance protein CutA [Neisseriaceae bacterium]
MTPCLVWCSIDTQENAQRLAHQLVADKVAACVSILPQITSVYVWAGNTEQAQECLLLIKSSTECFDALSQAIVQHHPYEVPEILMQTVTDGHPPYLAWLQAHLQPQG